MDYTIAQAVYRSTADLTATETLLLYTLAGAAKDPSTLPSPSIARLADRSHLAARTVLRTIAGLQDRGIITISKRRTASGKLCNVYIANIHRLAPSAPVLESVAKDDTVSPVTPDLESYNNNKPDRVSPMTVCHPTPDTESPVPLTQSHATPDTESHNNNTITNKEDNIDKQASNMESNIISNGISNKETPTPTKEVPKMDTTPTQAKPAPAADDAPLTLKTIAIEARDRLFKEGMPMQEAVSRIKAVRDAYVAKVKELKANGYPGIRDKQKYLVVKLVGMAKEGPKQPQAEEPTSLDEIFDLLKKEWAGQYPEVADHIANLALSDFWQSTLDKLRAKENAGWATVKGSRVAYVRSTLEGTVFERVQAWRHTELHEVANYTSSLSQKITVLKTFPESYYRPLNGPTREEYLGTLEERLTQAKAKHGNLVKLTTRPSAA